MACGANANKYKAPSATLTAITIAVTDAANSQTRRRPLRRAASCCSKKPVAWARATGSELNLDGLALLVALGGLQKLGRLERKRASDEIGRKLLHGVVVRHHRIV